MKRASLPPPTPTSPPRGRQFRWWDYLNVSIWTGRLLIEGGQLVLLMRLWSVWFHEEIPPLLSRLPEWKWINQLCVFLCVCVCVCSGFIGVMVRALLSRAVNLYSPSTTVEPAGPGVQIDRGENTDTCLSLLLFPTGGKYIRLDWKQEFKSIFKS